MRGESSSGIVRSVGRASSSLTPPSFAGRLATHRALAQQLQRKPTLLPGGEQ